MDGSPLVVGVCGSRRRDSHTRSALRHALDAASDAGADTELLDLGAVDLPLYHPDKDLAEQGDAEAVVALTDRADALLIGSPVYHGSYSSTLKNWHDYCGSDEFDDTVAGLVAVAGGSNYEATLEHMQSTFRHVHAHVVSEQVGVPHGDVAAVADRLDTLGRTVVEAVRMRRARSVA
ncbi:MAG: NADPH-dependent FMN reductase [Halobacteriaceae archaeon]